MAVLGTTSLTGCDSIPDFIGTGSIWIFHQTNAPTSWTKITTLDNRCLRITNGSIGDGGTNPFTNTLTSGKSFTLSGGNHTLSTGELAAHSHPLGSSQARGIQPGSPPGALFPVFNSNTGESGAHSHGGVNSGSFDFSVKYIDVIFASKN
jgi:hypothetical protein